MSPLAPKIPALITMLFAGPLLANEIPTVSILQYQAGIDGERETRSIASSEKISGAQIHLLIEGKNFSFVKPKSLVITKFASRSGKDFYRSPDGKTKWIHDHTPGVTPRFASYLIKSSQQNLIGKLEGSRLQGSLVMVTEAIRKSVEVTVRLDGKAVRDGAFSVTAKPTSDGWHGKSRAKLTISGPKNFIGGIKVNERSITPMGRVFMLEAAKIYTVYTRDSDEIKVGISYWVNPKPLTVPFDLVIGEARKK